MPRNAPTRIGRKCKTMLCYLLALAAIALLLCAWLAPMELGERALRALDLGVLLVGRASDHLEGDEEETDVPVPPRRARRVTNAPARRKSTAFRQPFLILRQPLKKRKGVLR